MNDFTIATEGERQRFISYLRGLDISRPLKFTWKLFKHQRSYDANALFHIWVGEVATAENKRGMDTTKDKAKKDLKKMFLGYESITYTDRKTGEVVGKTRLRRTRDLDSGEMFYFMEQVQAWAMLMLSLALTSKTDKDEFAEWKRAEAA